jgi:hypothetical protein
VFGVGFRIHSVEDNGESDMLYVPTDIFELDHTHKLNAVFFFSSIIIKRKSIKFIK